jgi:hypothetical protein
MQVTAPKKAEENEQADPRACNVTATQYMSLVENRRNKRREQRS